MKRYDVIIPTDNNGYSDAVLMENPNGSFFKAEDVEEFFKKYDLNDPEVLEILMTS